MTGSMGAALEIQVMHPTPGLPYITLRAAAANIKMMNKTNGIICSNYTTMLKSREFKVENLQFSMIANINARS